MEYSLKFYIDQNRIQFRLPQCLLEIFSQFFHIWIEIDKFYSSHILTKSLGQNVTCYNFPRYSNLLLFWLNLISELVITRRKVTEGTLTVMEEGVIDIVNIDQSLRLLRKTFAV
ncbi:hypothetical protein HHI36_006117 [Cryptolaemus montrouzieri]|uniref:Maturase K n=1 Tax=Cryptolaemus montrouzieri TaxID=559131 RepID=A0ABD2NWB3_9CUCU